MGLFFNSAKAVSAIREPIHSEVPSLNQAQLAAVYYGERVGGDLYDFLRVTPDRVLFGMLDVAGRVEDNQQIVSSAQQTFRGVGAALFKRPDLNEADAMIELCLELNRTILQAEGGGVRSCPAFAACYNETLGTLCYFNAGHTPGLLRDEAGVTELKATGLPLGLFSHTTCDAPMAALPPGSALLLVSRGVVEAKHKSEEYGLDRVKECLNEERAATAQEVCTSVLDDVQRYMGAATRDNDVTALALVRTAQAKLVEVH